MYFRKIIFLLLNPLIISTLTAQNPLSVTGNFTVFVERNTSIMSGDVEGGIAMGGNFVINGTSNLVDNYAGTGNIYGTIDSNNYVLVVGGQIVYTSGASTIAVNNNVNRKIKINNLGGGITTQSGSNITIQNSGTSIQVNSTPQTTTNIIGTTGQDFTAIFTYLRTLSTGFSACTNTIIPTYDIGSTNPKISISPNTRNVWNITSAELNSWTTIIFNNSNVLNTNTPLIINVNAAGTFNWNTINMAGISRSSGAQYILWNFYNTTTLNIQGTSTLEGSILAPNATINKTSSANIEGQIIAVNYNQITASEVHVAHFNVNTNITHCCSYTISSQPSSLTECIGGTQTISVTATSSSIPLTYQWQKMDTAATFWNNITGAISATYTPLSTTVDTTLYRVIVSPLSGSGCPAMTSNNATVIIVNDPIVSVTTPSTIVCTGSNIIFSANVTGGTGGCTIQWQSSSNGTTWNNINGAMSSTLNIVNLNTTTRYRVQLISCTGSGCCN